MFDYSQLGSLQVLQFKEFKGLVLTRNFSEGMLRTSRVGATRKV